MWQSQLSPPSVIYRYTLPHCSSLNGLQCYPLPFPLPPHPVGQAANNTPCLRVATDNDNENGVGCSIKHDSHTQGRLYAPGCCSAQASGTHLHTGGEFTSPLWKIFPTSQSLLTVVCVAGSGPQTLNSTSCWRSAAVGSALRCAHEAMHGQDPDRDRRTELQCTLTSECKRK